MPLIRVGICNHCGKCCKPPVMVENPMIVLGEDRCNFYTDTENTQLYGHCLIYGRGGRPITAVKDRFGTKITQEQIDYFNANCILYPTLEDFQESGIIPPECSITVEVA